MLIFNRFSAISAFNFFGGHSTVPADELPVSVIDYSSL